MKNLKRTLGVLLALLMLSSVASPLAVATNQNPVFGWRGNFPVRNVNQSWQAVMGASNTGSTTFRISAQAVLMDRNGNVIRQTLRAPAVSVAPRQNGTARSAFLVATGTTQIFANYGGRV